MRNIISTIIQWKHTIFRVFEYAFFLLKHIGLWVMWGVAIPLIILLLNKMAVKYFGGKCMPHNLSEFWDTYIAQLVSHGELSFISVGMMAGTIREISKSDVFGMVNLKSFTMALNVVCLITSCSIGDLLYNGAYGIDRPAMVSAALFLFCVFAGMLNIAIVEMSRKLPKLSEVNIK